MEVKISNIKVYFVKYPIKKTLSKPCAYYVHTGFIFFKVFTNEGIFGLGEPSPYGGDIKKIIKIIKSTVLPLIINKKIEDVERNFLKVISFYEKNKLINNLIYAGLQQAILDIKGKILNKPVYRLLNKNKIKKEKISLYASGGMIFENQNYKILIEEALRYKELGYIGYKFRPKIPKNAKSHFARINKPPSFDLNLLIEFCYEIRKIVGDEFLLMLDVGCRLKKINEFKFLSNHLNYLNFFFLEEPLKRDYFSYKKIYNSSKIKIAAGESFSNLVEFKKWKNVCDIFQPDTNLFPINEIHKLKKNFEFAKKEIILHNWANPISMISNFHAAISLNSKLIEYNVTFNPIRSILLKNHIKITHGQYLPSPKAGFGIDINYDVLKKYLQNVY